VQAKPRARRGFRSSQSIQAENLFLRRQLALYIERGVKPRPGRPPIPPGLQALIPRIANENPSMPSAANQFPAACIMNTRWSLLAPDLYFADNKRPVTMPAYLISDVSIRDNEAFQVYRMRAAASITKFGGRYLARGGAIESLEGHWGPQAIVIVEFPDIEQARAWYHSPEYAAALAVRGEALSRNLILVDGVTDAA
jgi:uncharacterized protein (DUF1330 family)